MSDLQDKFDALKTACLQTGGPFLLIAETDDDVLHGERGGCVDLVSLIAAWCRTTGEANGVNASAVAAQILGACHAIDRHHHNHGRK